KHKKHKKKLHRDDGLSFSSEALESDSGMLVPTITVIPEAKRSVLPLNVESDDNHDSEDEVPSKGVPIEHVFLLVIPDEDSNLDPSPVPDMDTDSLLGELDDNRELKKEIDESPLTARQKALLHKQQSQTLLELPMGYREEELTAEMMQKREERARKRRLQAAKKAEENKNQTIERLTKTKSKKKGKSKQAQLPMVRYSSNVQGAAVSYPAGIPIPTPTALPEPSPAPTGALCSLQCYRKNLTLGQEVA
uniref:INO80 complex subunit B n=1 Tax=Cyprinus carpio TaxID=7962 RepID=A0A8C1WKU4_CYPCA